MILAVKEVQRSLYNYLAADVTLIEMVGDSNIYDAVPQQTSFPYIVIGEGVGRVVPADGVTVTDCEFEISVLTNGYGRKKALEIIERIYVLLHLGTMTVDGFGVVLLRVDRNSVSLEESGNVMRGKMTVIVTVAEVA